MNDWTIAHDFAFDFGGAERVTRSMTNMLPTSNVVFLGGEPEICASVAAGNHSRILFPRALVSEGSYRSLAPLYPTLLKLRPVIAGNLLASSYAFAHLLRVTGRKVVYCHSPLRQVWSGRNSYAEHMGRVQGLLWRNVVAPSLASVDRRAALRADAYVATSRAVASRLMAFYGIHPVAIIAPPVDAMFNFAGGDRLSSFLWVGRVVEPYKRVGLLIEAFRGMPDLCLRIVGVGRDMDRLAATAPENVTFVGKLNTSELAFEYQSASGVIFPSEDDYGMVVPEALSCGTPVVALRAGGALDTVREGLDGIFFDEVSPGALGSAIRSLESQVWNHSEIAIAAVRFSERRFQNSLSEVL